jgi:hypothetical protein
MNVRTMTVEAAAAAAGRAHRSDQALGRTGGPAGNAKLTAWTGLVLLILFLAELVTLLDVHGLLSWHIVIGTLLLPPTLLKTASTGWRMIGYYLGNQPYRRSGPPPMLLRLLGPLVVLSTVAVLGTGVALILAGPATSRTGFPSLLMWHKAAFLVWAAATGLHVLGRAIPALRLMLPAAAAGPVPGRALRVTTLVLTMAVAAGAALLLLGRAEPWRTEPRHFHDRPGATAPGENRPGSLGRLSPTPR